MAIKHKTVGKMKLTSGTWKSNIIIALVGFVLMLIGGAIFELIGLILFLVGVINLIVFSIQHFTSKK